MVLPHLTKRCHKDPRVPGPQAVGLDAIVAGGGSGLADSQSWTGACCPDRVWGVGWMAMAPAKYAVQKTVNHLPTPVGTLRAWERCAERTGLRDGKHSLLTL